MYSCILCKQELKLLNQHLRHKHKEFTVESYFSTHPLEVQIHEDHKASMRTERRGFSPNCIEFYLKKGYSQEDSETALKCHRNKLPFKTRKDVKPCQIGYWLKIGFNQAEAELKLHEFQSKSLNSNIKKYGKEKGTAMYNSWYANLLKRPETEIKNLVEAGHTEEEAKVIRIKRKCKSSPRRTEYWTNQGYTETEAVHKVSIWQKESSMRCIEHYVNKGYSVEDSIDKRKDYQTLEAGIGIFAIMKRFNCTNDEAFVIQDSYISKILNTFEKTGKMVPLDQRQERDKYYCQVWLETNKNYRKYKVQIDPTSKRSREWHLDHKFSIMEGFIKKVAYKVIGSHYNLEILDYVSNTSKCAKCSISLTELTEAYNENKI